MIYGHDYNFEYTIRMTNNTILCIYILYRDARHSPSHSPSLSPICTPMVPYYIPSHTLPLTVHQCTRGLRTRYETRRRCASASSMVYYYCGDRLRVHRGRRIYTAVLDQANELPPVTTSIRYTH